jgi:hypothetical protein
MVQTSSRFITLEEFLKLPVPTFANELNLSVASVFGWLSE